MLSAPASTPHARVALRPNAKHHRRDATAHEQAAAKTLFDCQVAGTGVQAANIRPAHCKVKVCGLLCPRNFHKERARIQRQWTGFQHSSSEPSPPDQVRRLGASCERYNLCSPAHNIEICRITRGPHRAFAPHPHRQDSQLSRRESELRAEHMSSRALQDANTRFPRLCEVRNPGLFRHACITGIYIVSPYSHIPRPLPNAMM